MSNPKKLKVGVIGAGFAGRSHMEGYSNTENADLIAVCDVGEERAKEAAKKYNIPNVFTDYNEMLKLDELEAVSVCLPNIMHMPASVAALESGKHVLCEKPLATNAEEAQKMVATAEKNGKILAMSLNFRYMSTSLTAKKIIQSGKLGEVYYAKTAMLRNNAIPKGWFHVKEKSGGGPLLDLAAHVLDVTWWLMGKPKPVAASGSTFAKLGVKGKGMGTWGVGYGDGPVDIEDMAVGLIRFEDGQTLFVEVSWALQSPPTQYCNIYGTEGGITVFPDFVIHKEPKLETEMEPDQDRISEFVKNILEGTKPLGPGEDGIEVMKMLDAIYRSAESGKEAVI
ncbi:gfo/Idh/MocA family oxidoreductase [Candidatus Poribacteria bacterium]|nr:gfo/Idh/MocA family oxidoreductase [Candidatus Poribacteria bacterium]